ncbi:MAG: restriction endonuclease subunit S [Bacteroides sp.]|nr:restriction endonuclease subunit S [Bacteroides sp.]MCM1379317.1 restriction endonuclease subunit S [Bacteroides sp.]MCM1445024.1 restriction endonuclease subunit S [Prevotella sp.]
MTNQLPTTTTFRGHTYPLQWKTLGEVFKRIKGTPITAKEMKIIANDDGDIRIFAGGKTVVNAFAKDIPNGNIIRNPAVIVQSRGIIDVVYYDKPFTFKNEMWAYIHSNHITLKFLYHFLKVNIKQLRDKANAMGAFPQISIPDTENLLIPIPPVELQEQIVEILDRFSALTAELQNELQNELAARREQYAYYRNRLLDFGRTNRAQWLPLEEVCKIKNGKDYKHLGSGEIPVYGSGGIMTYVDSFTYDKESVLLPRKGSIGKIHYVDKPFWNVDTVYYTEIDKSQIKPKFLYYYLTTVNLESMNCGTGAIPSLTQAILYKIPIPIPPLEEQERIVGILDRLEAAYNDLMVSIPAEIAARREQYAYYRNRLLSFAE